MSKFLTNAAVQEFDSEVKHEYQAMGTLRNTVTIRTGVVGDAYKFARMGKGMANQKASQANVTPMDVGHARQTANLENWNAPEYTDIFDQAEVNYDEKSELAQTIAHGLGRREDQIIIDAIAAGTFQTDPAVGAADIGATLSSGSALTVDALRAAAKFLNRRNVPQSDRHIIHSADDLEALLGTTQVTSTDYNAVKTLVNGEVDTFLGFKFHLIGEREEGGLPTNQRFCYHKSAVGYAVGIDMKTSIDWIAEKTSWLCNGMMKSGAVLREAAGVVRITTS